MESVEYTCFKMSFQGGLADSWKKLSDKSYFNLMIHLFMRVEGYTMHQKPYNISTKIADLVVRGDHLYLGEV